ncbi:MAG: hypothetical protein AB7G75_36245 [Candidatus Binatia bacterium]
MIGRRKTSQDAYQKGYDDGCRMAEQMRWQGTPIGNVLKGSRYDPDPEFPGVYADGFAHAMAGASRLEWQLLKEKNELRGTNEGLGPKPFRSVA